MSTTLAYSTITTAQPSSTSPSVTTQTLPTARDTLGAFPTAVIISTSTSSATTTPSSTQDNGPISYYFVFFALIICVVAFAGFIFWRRRRKMLTGRSSHRPPFGRARVVNAPTTQGAQPWLGRWRSAEVSREEGLNEHGEAPPPYVSKTYGESVRQDEVGNTRPESSGAAHPAIPLQALTRERAGQEPPDYASHPSAGHSSEGSRQVIR